MQIVTGTIVLHDNIYKFKPKDSDEFITLSRTFVPCKGFKHLIYTQKY